MPGPAEDPAASATEVRPVAASDGQDTEAETALLNENQTPSGGSIRIRSDAVELGDDETDDRESDASRNAEGDPKDDG